MASPKQRAASRANSLRSTGPRSSRGKSQAKLNATKHGLSLPVDERVFADLIQEISTLIRGDCKSDSQAYELAKASLISKEMRFFSWTMMKKK